MVDVHEAKGGLPYVSQVEAKSAPILLPLTGT